jgi:2-keto-4-pentenoate hydratase
MTQTPPSPTPTEAIAAATARLQVAARDAVPCPPVRDLLGQDDVVAAYRVQEALRQARLSTGAHVVGRKIGLTSPAVQQQLGVDQPDFGVLFDDMDVTDLTEVPSDRLLQPKVEAEIAFVLGSDLDAPQLDVAAVREAVHYAVAALEIVDSRVAGWDIRITDTVADNASSALFVLGQNRFSLREFEPADVTMTMAVNGQMVSQGRGDACLGDPLNALLWLAETARDFGEPLRAGQVVLSGALGPMAAVSPGDEVHAEISALGTVSATFSRKER